MAEEPELLTSLNFVQVTVRQIWSNLPLVIAGGLVFALACVPAALLGFLGHVPLMILATALLVSPSWTMLLDLLSDVVAGQRASLRQMPRAFLHYWPASARLSLIYVIPMFAAWLILPAFRRESVSTAMWIALFTSILALALAWSISLYAYPLVIEYELPALAAVRNGSLLASGHVANTVGLVSLAALLMVATGLVGIVLLFFIPGLYGMFVVSNYLLVVQTQTGPSER